MIDNQDSMLELPLDVEVSLSPREQWMTLHGINVIEPRKIRVKGQDVQVDWIATIGKQCITGTTRNEAVHALAQKLELSGWEQFNWDS